ncbi:MAG: hypothetical protein JWO98_4108 [Frankiales bacterium]|nr:hypothetical protein [Frankiales bacterium]
MQVQLTPSEFNAAVDIALERFQQSSTAGHNHASTYERTWVKRLEEETIGACGELVLCKALGRFWSPSVNTFHAIADVGQNIEVRATRRDEGSLILRDNDDPERWYVLVTGDPPTMTVRGCLRGRDGRRDEWLRDPHGYRRAWFVPQDALRPPPIPSSPARLSVVA